MKTKIMLMLFSIIIQFLAMAGIPDPLEPVSDEISDAATGSNLVIKALIDIALLIACSYTAYGFFYGESKNALFSFVATLIIAGILGVIVNFVY